MKPSMFDDVTKAMATSISRREALWRIGGILGGTALAGLFPGLALAKNKTCAQFCASVFGDNTAADEQCAADAAHGTGLCYSCGPASPGGEQPICCPQNPDGTCTSYSSATCCSSGQTCQNGTCASSCTTVVLANGTVAQPCTANSQCSSGLCVAGNGGGQGYCSTGATDGYCQVDSDCMTGDFCGIGTTCYTSDPCKTK